MKELNSNSLVIMLMQTKSIYINLSTRIDVRKKDRIQKQVSDLVVCQISVWWMEKRENFSSNKKLYTIWKSTIQQI